MEPALLKTLRGKAMVDIQEGRKVGTFEDLLVTSGDYRTAAIIVSRGNLLNRKVEVVSAEDVRVWGQDVILVDHPGVVRAREQIGGLENTVSASNVLKGHSVVSVDGKRIGIVDDFYISPQGSIDGLRLSQVYADGPISRMKMIPISAVRSLGPDVIIVEMDRVVFANAETDVQEFQTDAPAAPMNIYGRMDDDVSSGMVSDTGSHPSEIPGAAVYSTPERR